MADLSERPNKRAVGFFFKWRYEQNWTRNSLVLHGGVFFLRRNK